MKIVYVLGVLIDPIHDLVVGITKKKGPVYLLNKVTFPGGKKEVGESPQEAIAREFDEEVGVTVPSEDWLLFKTIETPEYTLHLLCAHSSAVSQAYQREIEPVWTLSISASLANAAVQPTAYVPDFIPTLRGALQALQPNSLVT